MPVNKKLAVITDSDGKEVDYNVETIHHHVVYADGRIEFLVQWEGYLGHENEFTFEPKDFIDDDVLMSYYGFIGVKLEDPLGDILREWQTWRLTNTTPLLKYKRIVLDLAKARQFGTLMFLLPPAVTQSIEPSQPASGSLPEVAAVASAAVDKGKAKAKPEPRPGRRKSTCVLNKLSEATVEASPEDIAAKLVDGPERSQTKTASARQVAQESFEEAALSNTIEHEALTWTAISDIEDDLDSLSHFMQNVFLEPTNIKASHQELASLSKSAEHEGQETTGRNVDRKDIRPRRSTICTVASNGSPMPDIAVESNPATPTPTATSHASNLTSNLGAQQGEEFKENAAVIVVDVKKDTSEAIRKEGLRRRKSMISLGVLDWLPDLFIS